MTRVDLTLNFEIVEKLLTGFIADETRRAGMKKVVVGLSGGIDSALSARGPGTDEAFSKRIDRWSELIEGLGS